MGMFDNDMLYNRDEYGELDFADHRDLFLRIRSWVAEASKEVRSNKTAYRKLVIKKIEQIAGYACSGHIPSQDYMGYIYKRGMNDFFPINYRRALEWNIIAARNGSKLAPEKMKMFLNPAVDMIFLSPKFTQIVKVNGINRSNYFWFFSQYICDILYSELKLSEVEMAKKDLIEEDANETSTIIFLDRFRNRSVEKALERLIKALPDDISTDDDKDVYSVDDLDNPDGDKDIDTGIDNL